MHRRAVGFYLEPLLAELTDRRGSLVLLNLVRGVSAPTLAAGCVPGSMPRAAVLLH